MVFSSRVRTTKKCLTVLFSDFNQINLVSSLTKLNLRFETIFLSFRKEMRLVLSIFSVFRINNFEDNIKNEIFSCFSSIDRVKLITLCLHTLSSVSYEGKLKEFNLNSLNGYQKIDFIIGVTLWKEKRRLKK